MATTKNPSYTTLAALSENFRRRSRALPAQIDLTPVRTVVCFRILGVGVAVLLEEMNELLEVPHCTRLPRVKSWVKGVANVRGKLTPIIDFAGFLGSRLTAPPKRQRVLLVERETVAAGLIVDEVVGMKHFRVDAYSEDRTLIPPPLSAFVPGTFLNDGERWVLFRPDALFSNNEFLEVAA
ncbi:MAG: chemotaxis protein CheW [Porticoccaceae bacterium]|jgi:twitching motility protein PilI|nr:chemotaxis protein CheW [Porticoccaceae bacterium]